MYLKNFILAFYASFCFTVANAQDEPINKQSFSGIDLGYHGLEKVSKLVNNEQYAEAGKELLRYYQNRKNINHPDFNIGDEAYFRGKPIGKANQEKADNALEHKFQPQKGYGYYDYGKDINWKYWPVKDNEVRWQLHRLTWWEPMGLAYRSTVDEKYAKEWILQFRDWASKNAFGRDKENDRYAWRPLEVSERIQSLPGIFNLFINSPNFTPAFLMEFLKSYNEQATYIMNNYSEVGNHLLFESQRVLSAGAFFPEFKNAAAWRKSGITVLNAEIKKQVYPDGVQFELSTTYHVAVIEIFLKAYNSAKMAGVEKEFPESYIKTIENMIMATANFSFPDYNVPMFGDSWAVSKDVRLKQYQDWAKVFPNNKIIQYFATNGKEGQLPGYLSHGLTTAGFYTFRNGWNDKSTIMVLKASPPGEFHAQPDNGTFELWVKGRNFMPDAGCYVYEGDAEINKQRNWYRQTRVHSTLTLDNTNMVITKAQQNKWETGNNLDVLTYTNPSYANLNHQRSVLFVDQKFFLIFDRVIGTAKGTLGIHFQLKEDSKPTFDETNNKVFTNYVDGNNLLIQCLNVDKVKMKQEEGKVSYIYKKEMIRPSFVFEKNKTNDNNQGFVSIVYPFDGNTAPIINVEQKAGNDFEMGIINLIVTVDGKSTEIKTTLGY